MEIKGLDLDNSPITTENKTLKYAENIEVDDSLRSYRNEKGFKFIEQLKLIPYIIGDAAEGISGLEEMNRICGVITTNIGFVLFVICRIRLPDGFILPLNTIVYLENENDTIIYKKVIVGDFNFNFNRPITGDYTYNYKNELIITFTEGIAEDANETRIININDPTESNDPETIANIYVELVGRDMDLLDIIPSVTYPTLIFTTLQDGNLKTGSYQIAIRYKLPDNTYTNYSILHPSIIICGNYDEDYAVGVYISRSIQVSFQTTNIQYLQYQLAIVYEDTESQTVYQTEDITQALGVNRYVISNVEEYNSISLDDVLVNTIGYIKDATHVNFNNRLIRGNVKTVNYEELDPDIQKLADNANVILRPQDLEVFLNKPIKYFQQGEVYSLYLGAHDYKGQLINIHKINHKSTDETTGYGSVVNSQDHLIPIIESSSTDRNFNFADRTSTVYYDSVDQMSTNTITGREYTLYRLDKVVKSTVVSGSLTYEDFTNNIPIRYNSTGYNLNTQVYKRYGVDNYEFLKSGASLYKITNTSTSSQTITVSFTANYTALQEYLNQSIQVGLVILQANGTPGEFTNFQRVNDWINSLQYFWDSRSTSKPSGYTPPVLTANITIPASSSNYYYFGIVTYLPYKAFSSALLNRYVNVNNFSPTLLQNPKLRVGTLFSNLTRDIESRQISGNANQKYLLNINISRNILSTIDKRIKSISIYFVEHNNNNARILDQAPYILDTDINNFPNNQTYQYQFASKNKIRFYPFTRLFNKTSEFNARLQLIYRTPNINPYFTAENNSVPDGVKALRDDSNADRNEALSSIEVSARNNLERRFASGVSNITKFKYITNNVSTLDNIAGDSFYRVDYDPGKYDTIIEELIADSPLNTMSGNNPTYNGVTISNTGLVNLINVNNDLYTNEYNQKLQIASSIYALSPGGAIQDLTIPLVGDTFLSYMTLRATTPGGHYRYGDASNAARDATKFTWRWIFTYPIESKYNILARYSLNQINKSWKLFDSELDDRVRLYKIGYEIDNFINSDTGQGYNIIYNENGIQDYLYFKDLSQVYEHVARIIRSDVFNTESNILSWRYFRADDYTDMPSNRGDIISLKTDNKNLYIQQRYGLRLAQLRDTLSTTEDGTSHLGSADLFDIEPEEIIYSKSGYIGASSIFDTDINVSGYFVLDVERKKIFQVFGKEVKEISDINSKHWFEDNIINSTNNPYIGLGRYFLFNEVNNTLYFIHGNDRNPFVLSFKVSANRWISFHNWSATPGMMMGITNRKNTIWIDSRNFVYFVDKNSFGKYCLISTVESESRIRDSIIKICLNDSSEVNKFYKNIVWKDVVEDTVSTLNVPKIYWNKTFYQICIHDQDMCTGYLPINTANKWYDGLKGVNKTNVWRFNNILDIARSNNFLRNQVTLNPNELDYERKWFKKNKFITQFVYVILKINNEEQLNHEVCEIDAEVVRDNRMNE